MNRGSALRRQGGGGWSPGEGEPHPYLATAAVYIDAGLQSDGRNQGTAGSSLDASTAAFVPAGAAGFDGQEASAATTADKAALDLTDGFCVAVDLTVDWQPAEPQQILSKPTEGNLDSNDCYAVGYDNTGFVFIEWNDGDHHGPSFWTGSGATADVTFDAGVARRQLVYEFIGDNGLGGWTARLYSGTPDDPTLLSEIVNTTDGAQTIVTSTDSLRVGDPVTGVVHRVRLYDTLGGTLLADFNPEQDWSSGTTMVSGSTGETWSNVTIADADSFALLVVDTDTALDIAADVDATIAFWWTQRNIADVDGESITPIRRNAGTLGAGGEGYELLDVKIVAFASDFAGAVISDGTNNAFAAGAHWTAGAHLAVLQLDRGTDTATLTVDGTEWATADISAVGAIDPSAGLTMIALAHAVAKWDSLEDPATIAAVR